MPTMSTKPFVILYVEDNVLVRESVAEVLDTAQRHIVCVGDSAGARKAMTEQHMDLLMTDINLPDGSGIDVAREALRHHPGLPVILCSGHDTNAIAQLLGPTAHALRKPFELDELEALIERFERAERPSRP
jgi:DNA-binding NtrC family response regulator